ncbi:hypothetical protein N825_04470 [Skermanella stibiiresistens SB22]|uniref:PIN domain-containing protein n=1 Tax=Skermanella stibiiresistens SB22 TaxID=1385369 RepID=W9H7X3_9PROT|nr:hypothetical protein [Skermanella stibiiresistens]EWY39903.1 hypothetical protein N825_04470 [Skermanella stibiiresistens SB22]
MTKRVLVNTDFFLFLAQEGPLRKLAVNALQACQPCQLITPRIVVQQALDAVRGGRYAEAVARNMVEIMENLARHRFNAGLVKNVSYLLVSDDERCFSVAFSEYKRRTDLNWPLTRHLLIALAKKEGVTEVLSAQVWFSEYGLNPRIEIPATSPSAPDAQTAGNKEIVDQRTLFDLQPTTPG